MALRGVTTVERRLEVLKEAERTGETVTEVCRRNKISRQTYYRYKRLFEQFGIDGLEPLSRRPFRSPVQMDPELEDRIFRMRKEHPRWGARTIRNYLRRAGVDPPAISSIHQALVRNHLVAPQPQKGRRKARQRFERSVPNDLWQTDGTEIAVTTGARPTVISLLDDHARFILASVACFSETTEAAWVAFSLASSRYGLPRQLLSDNGSAFTGRPRQQVVSFERKVAALEVKLINGRAYHPETQGKIERFHRTLKEWLYDEGPPTSLEHLQELLDRFRPWYNEVRPHQGLPGDVTPAERYRPSPTELPPTAEDEPPVYPAGAILRKVGANGAFTYDNRKIGVGVRWAGHQIRLIAAGEVCHVYYGDRLLRDVAVDPSRGYQPQLRPKMSGRTPRR